MGMHRLPIAAILLVIEKFHPPGIIVLKALLIPALVLSTVAQPGNLLGRVLEWQPLRWIGTISYSLYLWQEIFLPQLASEKSLGGFTMFSNRHGMCSPSWRVVVLAGI
jgi:peptidoglycan/LPS O-acetylase OafA/YrhL